MDADRQHNEDLKDRLRSAGFSHEVISDLDKLCSKITEQKNHSTNTELDWFSAIATALLSAW